MKSSLIKEEGYLTRGGRMTIQKFVEGIGKEVREWVGDESVTVIGITPDGIFYAEPLAEYLREHGVKIVDYAEIDGDALRALKKEITLVDKEGRNLDIDILRERKVLLVDNDIITGETYKAAMNTIRQRAKELKIKDVKFAVFEDRTGLADFKYKLEERVRLSAEYYNKIKEELKRIEPIKEKLLEEWKKVPREYEGEILATLLAHTKQWQEWSRDPSQISPQEIMNWIQMSLHSAAYAWPEINILEKLRYPEFYYFIKKEVPLQ